MRKTVGYAKVYDSPENAAEIEQDYMLDRNKIGAEAEAGDDEAEAEEA
jgi:small subunit ribosomal protein S24e